MKRKMQLNILGENSEISEELFVEKLQNFLFEEKKKLLMIELNLIALKKLKNQLQWFVEDEYESKPYENKADLRSIFALYSDQETQFKQKLMLAQEVQEVYRQIAIFMDFRKEWIRNILKYFPEQDQKEGDKVPIHEVFELMQTDLSHENLILHENMRIFAFQIARELRVYDGADRKRKSIFRQVD